MNDIKRYENNSRYRIAGSIAVPAQVTCFNFQQPSLMYYAVNVDVCCGELVHVPHCAGGSFRQVRKFIAIL